MNDLAAAREQVFAVVRLFADEMPALADGGYEGAGHGVLTPVKKPAGMKELDITGIVVLRSLRLIQDIRQKAEQYHRVNLHDREDLEGYSG